MDNYRWYLRFGLPFIAGILLLIATVKVWSKPQGETLAAILLGAALVLLGFAARDWIHNDRN